MQPDTTPAPIGEDALREALIEAQAGLEFAAARLPAQVGDFVPSHLTALKIVNAALASAAQPVAVPPGYVLVPVEPTAAMLQAILSEGEADAALDCPPEVRGLLIERAGVPQRYAAMLAAAPKAASQPAEHQQEAQSPVVWPVMPPSKRQSPVLFEDGYAEGWAKCLEACRAALAAASTTQATSPAVVEPLTSEQIQHLHHIEEFGLFCDYEEFEQIARAIEFAHGIGIKKGEGNG